MDLSSLGQAKEDEQNLKATLLRINGAMQVLQEQIKECEAVEKNSTQESSSIETSEAQAELVS